MPFLVVLLVAFVLSAVDAFLTRGAFAHRLPTLALWPQAFGLWSVYCLLALLPALGLALGLARLTGRDDSKRQRAARLGACLALVAAAPVALHGVLDRYTAQGGDVSALKAARPWLEAAGVAVGLVVAAVLVTKLAGKLGAAALGALALVCALGLGGWASLAPARIASVSRGQSVGRATPDSPNVLFLVWDTTRAQSLSLYGYERKTTPYLAKLADQAYVFDNARSAAVFTLSSHVSMLTGTYPSHHGASLTRQFFNPRLTPTVAAALRDAGYRTGAFVGTDVLRADTGVIEGFERFDDATDPAVTYTRGWALLHDVQSVVASQVPALRFNGNPHWIQDYQRPAPGVLDQARAWIENGDPRPWFCFINLYDVHWPYVPAESFLAEWVARDYAGPIDGYLFRSDDFPEGYELDARDKRHLTELYDGELAQLDDAVESFLAAVDGDDVAMLLTADHGEAFGEAGRYEHFDVIEPQVHVPLLLRPAGGTRSQYLDTPVSGIDVAPTLLGLAGLHVGAFGPFEELEGPRDQIWFGAPGKMPAPPGPELESRLAGRNLLAGIAQAPDRSRLVLVENRDKPRVEEFRVALYQGPWKLVRNGVGERATWQLFRHEDDPYEEHDLAAENAELVGGLRLTFDTFRAEWGAQDVVGPGATNLDAMEGLGYIGNRDED